MKNPLLINKGFYLVPGTGIEPVRPLFTKAADFKSAVSTYFTTQAIIFIAQSLF
jgi:hypothetical protein